MKGALGISLSAILIIIFSCNPGEKKSYAIRDFSSTLRPYLKNVVSKGIVGFDASSQYIKSHATDKELKQLSQSEHPVLRAVAFRSMLERSSFNNFDLLMSHLDDTSVVAIDAGEWGIGYRTVSDDIIEHSKWNTIEEKKETINTVLTKHNYLRSAYKILWNIEPNEKYYSSIKEMVQRDRIFEEREYALIALASFKKPEDVKLIKKILLANLPWMSFASFHLLKVFNNEAYFEVLKTYYNRGYYSHVWQGNNSTATIDFVQAIAKYNNKEAVIILDSFQNQKPFLPCINDTTFTRRELLRSIWYSNSPFISYLRKQIEPQFRNYEKTVGNLDPYSNQYYPLYTSINLNRW